MLFRKLVGVFLIIITSIVSLNKVFLPLDNHNDASLFSASNVFQDIQVISKEPHSVEHPQERSRVREYLYERLAECGADPVVFYYDSVESYKKKRITIGNVYGVLEPAGKKANSYVMLIAHLDSRFTNLVKGKEQLSLGAADDGYGLGVILELIRISRLYQKQWSQGIKILFTDSEEYGLDGIKHAYSFDKHIFDKVGLIINFEARGVKGPAVLFETSVNNKKVIELYKHSKKPTAFSLTSAVYSILPNYTDFSVLKEDFPGMNFSVVDNLNYYHTAKDNIENISIRSIQHYGVQTQKIVKEYLVNKKYSSPDYLLSDSNVVYFSIPYIGIIVLSNMLYFSLNIFILVIFLIMTLFYVKQSRIRLVNILKITGVNTLYIIITSIALYFVSRFFSYTNGLEYKLISLAYVDEEYPVLILCLVSSTLLFRWIYLKLMNSSKVTLSEYMASALLVLMIFSATLLHLAGDSTLFFVSLLCGIFSYVSLLFKYSKFISLLGLVVTLLYLIPLLYLLYVALAFGSLPIINALVLIYVWMLFPTFSAFTGTYD